MPEPINWRDMSDAERCWLVAEKVMGWRPGRTEHDEEWDVPDYLTDPAATQQLLDDALKTMPVNVLYCSQKGAQPGVVFVTLYPYGEGARAIEGPTLGHALAIARLKQLGYQVIT